MADEAVLLSIEGGIAQITIDRPKALNALNRAVLEALAARVGACHGKARGILVTGAGEKAFVAGADIAEMADLAPEAAEEFSRHGQAAMQTLQEFPGPVVAAVNGYALGGGLELALACDVIVAADTAKLGLPESTLAVVPGFGGSQRLARRVGPARAKLLMMTGRSIGAEEALAMGLVDQVVAPDELLARARATLEQCLRNGPLAVAECKRLVHDGVGLPLEDALFLESQAFGRMFGTRDQKEGMKAFLEKRKPRYEGR